MFKYCLKYNGEENLYVLNNGDLDSNKINRTHKTTEFT